MYSPCLPLTLRFLVQLEDAEDWEEEIDDIITKFEQETGRRPLYTICFY